MLYPIYVYKDQDSAYSAQFPDFVGCYTAADSLDTLPSMAQEALELHCEGQSSLPAPSSPEQWQHDPDYRGGFWLLVDIDQEAIIDKPTRVNISLPSHLLHDIDQYAKAHHLSRSGLLAKAAKQIIGR